MAQSADPTATSSQILLVDDDEMVRRAFERFVSSRGFSVLVAKDGWQAMKLCRRNTFSVVVLDYRMPGIDGLSLKEELGEMLPDASYILLSGNVDLNLAIEAVNEHAVHFVLAKPWNAEELASTLNRAIEASWERSTSRRVAEAAVKSRRAVGGEGQNLLTHEAQALLAALRARDEQLSQAGERIAGRARAIGEAYGLAGTELVEVETAGMLCYVGYLGVPDAILAKQGPLDAAERTTVRRHTQLAADLLSALPALAGVRQIISHMQECVDGSGYPQGLSGAQICLGAKIVAIAVAFEAMTSERPYRPAMSAAAARDEIVRVCGTQLDSDAVAAFLRTTPAP